MTAGPGPAGRDPGLQPERTRLAWRRTTLSAAVVAVLAVKTALHGGASGTGVVLCAVCCGLWLGFLRVAHHRIRTLSAGSPPPALTPRHATTAVLCAVAMAACAAVLVV
ncbi:DUF202 domain-containing protein [Streptomyces naphthomycinicus]|uniref:DUF202 domain-containing protein n=1 Tax=Streptomyces naphthomycinicus TaxID=2872625 RepID=UPI001CEC931A|nr:DUF202 domain-containing protein [Streptomyces sp. TML10]